ncbi:MAG: hypothetical protein ACFFE8_11220 [Candidatus Heimdallarchaeota archaeon]
MKRNLIAVAGLSHSGKDLLFNQLMKLGKTEPDLGIRENVYYYDLITTSARKRDEDSYVNAILPTLEHKVLMKTGALIYIHDITYQRLDDTAADFQEITKNITDKGNHDFQVLLILNRGHLITNEAERQKLKDALLRQLHNIYPKEISTYIVSLKGTDEQRITNLVFTQIIRKTNEKKGLIDIEDKIKLDDKKFRKIINEKMEGLGFSGAYILSRNNYKLLAAAGKTPSWEENVGPQIVRFLAANEVFEFPPEPKINIQRMEDFLNISIILPPDRILVLIGKLSRFKLGTMSYPEAEKVCMEFVEALQ